MNNKYKIGGPSDYKKLSKKPIIKTKDNDKWVEAKKIYIKKDEEQGYKKKPYKKGYKKDWKPKEEKFDIEKWIKQHQNIEYPKRGKKNTLDSGRRKR